MKTERLTERTLEKSLQLLQEQYEKTIGAAESIISKKVGFEFSIFWQPSDGFVIADANMGNAPLESCMEVIQQKGHLSAEDYKSLKI